jgi:CRP-like cAMP-binding protein
LTNSTQQTLSTCALFSPLTHSELSEISAELRIYNHSYQRDQVVAFEDDPCSALGVVASGSVHIQRIFPSGKLITLETFRAGDSFGEALIFSDVGKYPATLVAKEDSHILYVTREDIIQLCTRYPQFLAGFLRTLSNRILLLNSKIKSLSYTTIRQKVAHYLLEEHRRQKTRHLTLNSARFELADSLGIPRPSLSRELIAMRNEGWIDFDRKTITVNNPQALEEALRQ